MGSGSTARINTTGQNIRSLLCGETLKGGVGVLPFLKAGLVFGGSRGSTNAITPALFSISEQSDSSYSKRFRKPKTRKPQSSTQNPKPQTKNYESVAPEQCIKRWEKCMKSCWVDFPWCKRCPSVAWDVARGDIWHMESVTCLRLRVAMCKKPLSHVTSVSYVSSNVENQPQSQTRNL